MKNAVMLKEHGNARLGSGKRRVKWWS